ncbi:MAG: STAS domain-containing protein [Spirochaetaceae bacterium]|jgi:anti-anti-sigma factor|nr:STAS domain-containing protein [Spirochaetaceae bacterium]
MGIVEHRQGAKVVLLPDQRLDAASAPELETKIAHIAHGDKTVNLLVIDLSKTSYISSLGLRVLLQGLKMMKSAGGNFSIQNINPQIRPVFEMAGLMELMVREKKMIILQKDEVRLKVTLSLEGKLTDETALQFEEELKQIANKYVSIELDCSHLNFICNKGFDALRTVHNYIAEKGGSLILMNTSERINQLISGEKLDGVFNYSPVDLKIYDGKAVFYLTGCMDELIVFKLRNQIDRVLNDKNIKEICLDVDKLTYASKSAVIMFSQIQSYLIEKNIALKLIFDNSKSL